MNLTSGEQLLLWRRRKGLTQRQVARKLRLTPKQIHRAELNQRTYPGLPRLTGGLMLHERCLITRRRAKLTQRAVAARAGYSTLWIQRMEQGLVDCTPLSKALGL